MSIVNTTIHNAASIKFEVQHLKGFVTHDLIVLCDDGSKHTITVFADKQLPLAIDNRSSVVWEGE